LNHLSDRADSQLGFALTYSRELYGERPDRYCSQSLEKVSIDRN
jgi:hypothetical protein